MFEASSSSLMIEGSFLRSSTTVLRKTSVILLQIVMASPGNHLVKNRSSTTVLRKTSVILLQIVMASPGNHLVKNHESQSRTNESQFKKRKTGSKLKMLGRGLHVTRQLI